MPELTSYPQNPLFPALVAVSSLGWYTEDTVEAHNLTSELYSPSYGYAPLPILPHSRGNGLGQTLPATFFVNKVLLEHATPICLCIICGCFPATIVEFSNGNKDGTATRPKSLTIWPFSEKVCWPCPREDD